MKINSTPASLTLSAVAMVLSIGAAVLGPMPSAHAASSEIFDIDPSLQSRIAREKIKQRGPRRGSRQGSGSSDNCGQVDIGNNNSNNSARSRVNPRVNVTVVQGPVINAARCR